MCTESAEQDHPFMTGVLDLAHMDTVESCSWPSSRSEPSVQVSVTESTTKRGSKSITAEAARAGGRRDGADVSACTCSSKQAGPFWWHHVLVG